MIRSTLEFWYSCHTTYRNTGILPQYQNIREKYRNTCEDTNTGFNLRNEYSRRLRARRTILKTHSPKLVSFPCSLWRLIWVYTVCIGLSVPIIRFFKFLICASFEYVSNEKRLNKISLFFSRRGFPPRFHVTYCYEHMVS